MVFVVVHLNELIVSLVDSISAEGKLAYISDDAAESIDLL